MGECCEEEGDRGPSVGLAAGWMVPGASDVDK